MMNEIHRLVRYLKFIYQYIFWEKPQGLDFTMRDTSLFRKSGGLYHGYSKTDEKHLFLIFTRLMSNSNPGYRLLDIGCGKGVVLKEAAKFPFEKVAGIEIQPDLVEIAGNNFRILGMEDRVECIEADAMEFDGYGAYNLFFLFNPFAEAAMNRVIDKMLADRNEEEAPLTVIYHNPMFMDIFERKGKVTILERLHDPVKDYDTCIFRLDGLKKEVNYYE